MKIKGKCNWTSIGNVDTNRYAEIELTPQELAEQLTNEEWDEIKLIKWQYEKPKSDKITDDIDSDGYNQALTEIRARIEKL